MQKTDASALKKYYNGIPDNVNSRKPKRFNSVIVSMLSNTTKTSDNISSYDKYLLGMAYLNGIDVEINTERAVQLLTESAEAECTEAIEKLVDIYYYGGSVGVDYHKALKWQKYLVEIYQKQSVDEEVLADNLGYLGNLYDLIAEYDKALEYNEKSLEIREKILGTYHPDTADSYNNIGVLYDNLGEYDKALEYYEKAFEIYKTVFGEDDETTLELNEKIVRLTEEL